MALDICHALTLQLDLKWFPPPGLYEIKQAQFQCWTECNRFEMKLN